MTFESPATLFSSTGWIKVLIFQDLLPIIPSLRFWISLFWMKEATWKQHGQMGIPRVLGKLTWILVWALWSTKEVTLKEWLTFSGLQCQKNGIHLSAWMVVRTRSYEIGKFLGKNGMFIQQLTPQGLSLSRLLSSIRIQTWIRHHPPPWGIHVPVGKTGSIITMSCPVATLMGWVGDGGKQWMPWEQRKSTYPTFAKSKSAGLHGGGDI